MMSHPVSATRGRIGRRAAALLALIVLAAVVALGTRAEAQGDSTALHHVSSLHGLPGYSAPVDPESMSVVLGRRANAPTVSKPFRGGVRSLNDLGRAVCRALHQESRDSLMALCIHVDEFRDILWREFPQSRPATGLQWQDAWIFLYARLHAGCSHAVRDYGGHAYEFVRFERDSVFRYRNFNLHNHLILVARDDEGQVHHWRWLRSAAERKGLYKIYSTED